MIHLLLHILIPGVNLPPGATQYSLSHEGLSWGWAFFALVLMVAAVAWSYFVYGPNLSRKTRMALVALRSVLLGLLLLLLIRPVLLITVEENLRRPLLVLLDMTKSMGIVDHRVEPDDVVRLALAKGLVNPAGGVNQTVSGLPPGSLQDVSRQELLEDLAGNSRLNLWPRLYAGTGLKFYGFGRRLAALGDFAPHFFGGSPTTDDARSFFHQLQADENSTALGDSLGDLLNQQRGQEISGVLVISDGANNAGSPPVEAADLARQAGVPLYIYGVGVTNPLDIAVSELDAPQTANVKERMEVPVRIRAQGVVGQKAVVQLKADGKIVDQQPVEFRANGEQELTLSYTPEKAGLVNLEAFVPPLPEETVKANNLASAQVQVTDDKIKVLLIEGEPRWDYMFLHEMLKRDRRFQLQTVLLKGDPVDSSHPDPSYSTKLPEGKGSLETNDLVIIGDVDPAELGLARMKGLTDWVSRLGGSILFLAGPQFDPMTYPGTPLEALLPVETKGRTAADYTTPVQLRLTPAGEASPMLLLAQDPRENAAIWNGFPPVSWTAWVDNAKPGAQVFLTDPTPGRAIANGPMPVMALESYGLGQTFFMGFDQTYRWRSHFGEKYYTRIWGQIIQQLTGRGGASALTRLKTDKTGYLVGDRVRISGQIFKPDFEPLTDPEVSGTITIQPAVIPGQTAPAPVTAELRLQMIPGRPGEYHGETTASMAGSYGFATQRDPAAVLKFEVTEPREELSDIAMNEKQLRAMAAATGGQFLREEDLNDFPTLLKSQSKSSETFKEIQLAFTPYILVLMILAACAEWLWRRRRELK
jgi:hypothetical protein